MSNVYFKRGLQASLPSNSANIVDGAFYLTTDTNRLYVGKRNAADTENVLVELNQSINIVNSVGQLPTNTTSQDVGQFYYVKGSNILCVYVAKGTDPETYEWKQINPDTAINTDPQNVSVAITTNDSGNIVTATSTVTDTAAQPHSSVGVFNFKGSQYLNVGKETVGTTDYITFTPNIGAITGAANTTYEISSKSATDGVDIDLTASTNVADDNSSITIVGQNAVAVSKNATSGNIEISVAEPVLRPELSFDANGNLTVDGSIAGVSSNPVSGANVVAPTIVLDAEHATESNTGYKFANGTATLPVYTKSEVDDAIDEAKRTIDSMTYKGVIGVGGNATAINADVTEKLVTNASQANVGDTYKAANGFVLPGQTAPNGQVHAGDLIIAEGTDGNVTWSIVQSGNDQSISVTFSASNLGIEINDNGSEIGGISLAAGAHMAVTGSKDGNHTTITIAQDTTGYTALDMSGATTAVTQAGQGETPTTVTYVTGLDVDAYGNVVAGSVTTQQLTLTDTHNYLSDMEVTGSASGNNATITMTVNDHDNHSATGTIGLRSSSLTITTDSTNSNEIIANLEWGSF